MDISESSPALWCAPASTYRNSEDVVAAIQNALRPDPDLTVSMWADEYRWLSPKLAAEPGRYRTDRTPYLRDIMDALSASSGYQRIVFMKGAQVGATEAANNWLGYIVHWAPAPVIGVWPRVEDAEKTSKQRIEPMLEASPELRERIPSSKSREGGNTIRLKEFPGGIMNLTGANSAAGLRSMPAKYAILDEVDAYEGDVEGEGSPIDLVQQRLKTFGRFGKMFMISTPTIKGASQIERAYEDTDQRRFFVPCPFCNHMQWLRFESLKWDKGQPEGARYICEECEGQIENRHKERMLPAGEWRPTAECTNKAAIGFHLSALYSPVGWESWENIARNWEAAQGDDAKLKTFKNTTLGETWQERGEAPEWQRIYDRRDAWTLGNMPANVCFLTAGVDVQRDRIEVHVWGWARGLESWLVDVAILEGNTADINSAVWQDLVATLSRTWSHPGGAQMSIFKAAVDTGDGPLTPMIYSWIRQQGGQQIVAIKGDRERYSAGSPVVGPSYMDVAYGGKKIKRGLKLWKISGPFFKSETYRWLRLEKPTDEDVAVGVTFPDGYVHIPNGVNSEWVQQLVAEQLVSEKTRAGFVKFVWKQLRERNEALDCRVYARAMTWLIGADRWSSDVWTKLENQTGAAPAVAIPAAPVTSPAAAEQLEQAAPPPAIPARKPQRMAASTWI